ncbi:alpha/beta hydrolase [Pontixanthobacter gangjinensis]|uniref:Alpha/beta fold hydrolase n=1 Tax=Christiangramia aestuarii TaxID=1028746 RepID=A0A7K1LRT6_9FLAO|nr:alpha/beta fold hydrolase [Christiangramia aestuarii]MUP43507.1 alpha/beta fold hydrolase [Christiangramia aestuarii]
MKALIILFLFVLLPEMFLAQHYESFATEDGRISYQTFGTGEPLLIINGGPGMNSHGFAALAKILSESNKSIIYDQRGTGRSKLKEPGTSTLSLELMLDDIEALREHLDFEQWIILGHSFGGMLAYAYAAKYPHRVKAMIQSHSGGMDLEITDSFDILSRLDQTERDSLTYYSTRISLGDTSREMALKRARFLAAAYLYDKSLAPRIAERLTQGNNLINTILWNDLARIGFDVTEEMSRFSKPVLILTGKNEVAPVHIAEKAHATLPDSKLVVMPRCGHYGWLERPDIYLREVKDFLKSNSV